MQTEKITMLKDRPAFIIVDGVEKLSQVKAGDEVEVSVSNAKILLNAEPPHAEKTKAKKGAK